MNIEKLLIEPNNQNLTPLYHAFKLGKSDFVDYILSRIKKDAQKMDLFNSETIYFTNIFTETKDAKSKETIKTTVIGILRNVNKTNIKSSEFIGYMHWLVKENDIDSIKQLLNIFKNEKNYIYTLLQSISSYNFVTPLHIAVQNNFIEMVEYLLSFIKTDQEKQELLFIKDKNGMTILMIAFEQSNIKITQLILNKLKSNKDILTKLVLEENLRYYMFRNRN